MAFEKPVNFTLGTGYLSPEDAAKSRYGWNEQEQRMVLKEEYRGIHRKIR